MKQGDIVLVPFPFSDLSSIKTRPALVISKENNGQDIILLAITSIENNGFKIEDSNLEEGLLPKTSFIKLNRVVSLKKTIIRKKVAELKTNICSKVVKEFKELF
ncbi:MAG: type II toxin-antitoxin system PemK/MazF family toxin [Patescibacteria group bacterium]